MTEGSGGDYVLRARRGVHVAELCKQYQIETLWSHTATAVVTNIDQRRKLGKPVYKFSIFAKRIPILSTPDCLVVGNAVTRRGMRAIGG